MVMVHAIDNKLIIEIKLEDRELPAERIQDWRSAIMNITSCYNYEYGSAPISCLMEILEAISPDINQVKL